MSPPMTINFIFSDQEAFFGNYKHMRFLILLLIEQYGIKEGKKEARVFT